MNVKVLTKQELQYFKHKYKFELKEKSFFVYVNGYNRVTQHTFDRRLNIVTSVRRIIVSIEALTYWREHFYDKFSPIEVQNAMNFLKISYKDIDKESILKTMKALNA